MPHYCTLRVIVPCWSLLGFIDIIAGWDYHCFPPLGACVAPSGTRNSSQEGGGIRVRFRSGALGPASEVHNVLCKMELPSTSGGQILILKKEKL